MIETKFKEMREIASALAAKDAELRVKDDVIATLNRNIDKKQQ